MDMNARPDSPNRRLSRPKRRSLAMYARAGWSFMKDMAKREMNYRRIKPVDTLFYLTYRCTSRCQTCTFWQRTDKTGEMTLDDWKHAVDESAALGATLFELFGGDALLRKDILVPLVEYISSKPGLSSDLVTNSNLMTEDTAKGLVDAGLNDLWVSIDGVDETHNLVRGRKKGFTKVEQTVRWINEARGNTGRPALHANTTISNLNYGSFDRVLPFAEENGMDFHHLEYAGEFWDDLLDHSVIDGVRPVTYFVRQNNCSILANYEEARIIKAKVERMKKDARWLHVSLQTENVDKLTIEQMVNGQFDNRRCYITRTKISIDPRGNALGCPFFGSWMLGNIKEQPLSEIWGNEKHRRFIEHFENLDMALCDRCILGVQRNPTPAQDIRDNFNRALGRARE